MINLSNLIARFSTNQSLKLNSLCSLQIWMMQLRINNGLTGSKNFPLVKNLNIHSQKSVSKEKLTWLGRISTTQKLDLEIKSLIMLTVLYRVSVRRNTRKMVCQQLMLTTARMVMNNSRKVLKKLSRIQILLNLMQKRIRFVTLTYSMRNSAHLTTGWHLYLWLFSTLFSILL